MEIIYNIFMAKQGLEGILIRNQFYWESYQKVAIILVLLILLNLFVFGFIIYLYKTPPSPKYFATSPDGVPIVIVPLNQPLQNDEFVLAWAKKAVIAIYSLDFVTFRKTLQDNSIYFTWRGHLEFLNAYKASNNLEAVKEKQQVVSVEPTGQGKIISSGMKNPGQPYSWELTFPATFTYQNSENEVIKQTGNILMTIERASTLRYQDGIAISQLVFEAQ